MPVPGYGTYLGEVWVGVEAALLAHCDVALRAGITVRLPILGTQQVGRLTHGAQLAAGHGCNLWQRVWRFRAARVTLWTLLWGVAPIRCGTGRTCWSWSITGISVRFNMDAVGMKRKRSNLPESESLYPSMVRFIREII